MEAYWYNVPLRVWGQTRGEVEAPSQSHCCVSVSTGNSQDLAQLSDRGSLLPSLLGGLCADLSSNRWTPEAYCTLNSTTVMLPDQEGVALRAEVWGSPQLPWCGTVTVSMATRLTSRVWALYWAQRHTPSFLLMPRWPNCSEIPKAWP